MVEDAGWGQLQLGIQVQVYLQIALRRYTQPPTDCSN